MGLVSKTLTKITTEVGQWKKLLPRCLIVSNPTPLRCDSRPERGEGLARPPGRT
ncbi:hypothetical protein RESH_01524 [Rhodopirellula europaea SH398]|uniref:Uncharacterized protein n=1 Tax=Rhodopirellula europaea SH398 TaxID=1263868 RepID=M5S8L9_9BACT|nr:hypothetical protein RESH_01524 [Rhodopirellula europaea SH398]